MIHMKDRLFVKLQFSDFTTLVLYHTVVLFLLMSSFGGHSKVDGASQRIVAKIGDDIILPCQVEPAVDAVDLTVEWARFDLDPRYVHLRRDGVELLLLKHPLFRGRTSLSTNKLKCGDVSLKLSRVRLSDMGTYRCFVPSSGTKTDVKLVVGSVSPPAIHISTVSHGVLLLCKSQGWYPEPEVFWLDGEGHFLSAESTETVRGPDDLYTVDSRVTVENRQSNSFTCRVQQKIINQTRETHIYVPADPVFLLPAAAARISIVLAVCLLSVGAVIVVVWRAGRNKNKTTNNKELLMKEERDREAEGEKTDTKENFEEDLKENEEELKQVTQLISTLMVLKENLKKQNEIINLFLRTDKMLMETIKTQIAENKKKFFGKTKDPLENMTELNKRITKQEELSEKTDEMLKTTDELIMEMVEKKGKLERDKEQINKNLKETEKLREKLQRKGQLETEVERNDSSPSDTV